MIRSTFYGFHTALSGLNYAQKALDVTGNNITNMNTTGYTRQRVDINSIAASSYMDRYANANSHNVGQGVSITGISQLRDKFLDVRFRDEASQVGQYDSYLSALEEVAAVFDEVQTEKLRREMEVKA